MTATIGTQVFLPPNQTPAEFPSNNVQFFLGSKPIVLSPATYVDYTASTNSTTGFAQLTAELLTTALPLGNNTITAQFVGDSNYAASAVSNSATISNQAATTTAITSSNLTIQHGASVTFTAVVTSGQAGGPALTGTVQFTSNGTPFGSPVPLVSGQAQISTSSLSGGSLTIQANYSGDTNYQSSFSYLQEVVQLIATTTVASSSSNSIQQGSSVTFTATVTPAQTGGPAVGGTVTFTLNSATTIGTPSVVNGQAQFTTSTLPVGTDSISAQYNGDANYAPSTAVGVLGVNVTAGPDFNITFAPATLNVSSPGASASTTVTVTGSNGFNGAINFSPALCSGLPSESSCSFSPATVTGSGTTMLTVSTTAPSSLLPLSRHMDVGGWRTVAGAIRFLLLAVALLALGIQARRRRWNFLATALSLTLLIANAACGGGGTGGGVTPPTNPGTPLVQNQTVTVTVTSGTITHTFTFTLNVT